MSYSMAHSPVESQSVMDFDLTLSERREYPPDGELCLELSIMGRLH